MRNGRSVKRVLDHQLAWSYHLQIRHISEDRLHREQGTNFSTVYGRVLSRENKYHGFLLQSRTLSALPSLLLEQVGDSPGIINMVLFLANPA